MTHKQKYLIPFLFPNRRPTILDHKGYSFINEIKRNFEWTIGINFLFFIYCFIVLHYRLEYQFPFKPSSMWKMVTTQFNLDYFFLK